jgi:hypothetical protein
LDSFVARSSRSNDHSGEFIHSELQLRDTGWKKTGNPPQLLKVAPIAGFSKVDLLSAV